MITANDLRVDTEAMRDIANKRKKLLSDNPPPEFNPNIIRTSGWFNYNYCGVTLPARFVILDMGSV